MVNISTEMKKPYTPDESRVNHRKYSLVSGFSCQEAKVPVKTMMLYRSNITTEIPSTPTEYLMFNGLNQSTAYVSSIAS